MASLGPRLRHKFGRWLILAARSIRIEPSWNAEFWSGACSIGWGYMGLGVAARTHEANAATMPALTMLLGLAQVACLLRSRTKLIREYVAGGAAILWTLLGWQFCATHDKSPTLTLYVGEVGAAVFAFARLRVERKIG